MAQSRLALCVTGWHFGEDFYRNALALPMTDLYVVCHAPPESVPAWLRAALPAGRLLFRPNLGYDWGCYQQFLETGIWRGYAVVAFAHDDVTIKSGDLLDRCADALRGGAGVVGNGRVVQSDRWPALYPHCYAHARWIPPQDFAHDNVRGSFFATTPAALEALGNFEVFWDPQCMGVGYGNYSLRASCARWEARLGPNCFAFLSEEYLSSPWLDEQVRGGEGTTQARAGLRQRTARRVLAAYTRAYWRREQSLGARARMKGLRPLVRYLSGANPAGEGVA